MRISKYIKGFIGLAICGVIAYFAVDLGTTTNYWSPIGSDPIVSGLHLGSLNRNDLSSINHNPGDIIIQLDEKNNISETIKTSTFIENSVNSSAFKNIVKKNLLNLNNNIEPVNLINQTSIIEDSLLYDKDNLQNTIDNLEAFNVATVPTVGANVKFNSELNQYYPISERIGTEVDRNLLINKIIDNLETANNDNNQVINLEVDKVYKQPKITFGSPALTNLINQLNNSLNAQLTYEVGWHSYDIDSSTYAPWMKINDNGQIYLDQMMLKDYLMNSSMGSNIFTSKEEALANKQVMTGYLVNYTTEAIEDRKAILSNSNITRTLNEFDITIDDIAPIYTQEFQQRLNQINQELGPEFVYINLGQQFMWYYKNNQLIVATPVTSGTSGGHDTPTGLFEVQGKAMNVTLKGENDDGSKYESPVVYWIPFNGGIGIHDADNWRSEYGSDVYLYNGSHGCVNTPREKVKVIYENISDDCPILVE